jgi:hypothetical protein
MDLITAEKKDSARFYVLLEVRLPGILTTKKLQPKISIVQIDKNDPTVLKYKKE